MGRTRPCLKGACHRFFPLCLLILFGSVSSFTGTLRVSEINTSRAAKSKGFYMPRLKSTWFVEFGRECLGEVSEGY